jgi:hypothetical protein
MSINPPEDQFEDSLDSASSDNDSDSTVISVPTVPPTTSSSGANMSSQVFRAPKWCAASPAGFFNVLERKFKRAGIMDEESRYAELADVMLHEDVGETAHSMVVTTPTGDQPYTTLKEAILEFVIPKNFQEVQAKMMQTKRNEMKPSEYLAKLRCIATTEMLQNKMFQDFLLNFFRRSLPEAWKPALVPEEDIDKVAKTADALHEDKMASRAMDLGASSVAALASAPPKPQKDSRVATDDDRISRLEKLVETLALSVQQLASSQQSGAVSNHHQSENQSQPRNRWRNKSRGPRPAATAGADARAPSPSAGNKLDNGVCTNHKRWKTTARSCLQGCAYYEQFLSYGAAFAAQPSNSMGRQ